MVHSLFIQADSLGVGVFADGYFRPLGANFNNGEHRWCCYRPDGAVVPGASVTLRNLDIGNSTSKTSNAEGSYNFALLAPGNYSLSANATGFQGIAQKVTVALGASVAANLKLSISSQSETIDVTEQVTGVQTEDANLTTNFSAQQIAVLPNPGNDLSAVALTTCCRFSRRRSVPRSWQ
jgi:hypothetical protein